MNAFPKTPPPARIRTASHVGRWRPVAGLLMWSVALLATAQPLIGEDREPQTIIDDTCLLALRAIDRELKREGFTLRADNWTGLMESTQPLMINSQMFRGHEYVFSLAADPSQSRGRPLSIEIADRSGRVLARARADRGRPAVLKFEPPRTGTYHLVLRLDPDNEDDKNPTTALSAFMMAYR